MFSGLIVIFRARWPTRVRRCTRWLSVSLVHAAYLGGVFAAIKMQMPAGIASLLVGLQPLLTAVLAWQFTGRRCGPASGWAWHWA